MRGCVLQMDSSDRPPDRGRMMCSRCDAAPRMHRRSAWCRRCASAYERDRRRANADEINRRQRADRLADPIRYQSYRLKRFGLTIEQFEGLFGQQGGRCAICNVGGETLHIDHDHACCPGVNRSCGGCVRGLLCMSCNNGLGRFRDDPVALRRAAEYVAISSPMLTADQAKALAAEGNEARRELRKQIRKMHRNETATANPPR